MQTVTYRYLPLPTVTYRYLPLPTVIYRYLPFLQVADLTSLLEDRALIINLISSELADLKAKHATPRRTTIGTAAEAELSEIDLTPAESCILIRTARGYVKRLLLEEFDAQNRGTRGKAGMTNMRDADVR